MTLKLHLRKRRPFSQCYGMTFHQASLQLSVFKKTRCISMPSPSHFHIKAYYCILLAGMDVQKNRREDEKEWGNLRHLAH